MATAPQMAANQALPTGQTADLGALLLTLLQTLGGTQTTTASNPGDITALQTTLSQLQGADYNAMLQSVFQQAGGQIPGLQTGLGNAVGARSGSNSAVAAALQKLLQQTTIAGQEQIAKQQLANQQLQVQAGQSIANATKGTQETKQQGTNVSKGASGIAKAGALTQLLSSALKLSGKGTLQEALGLGSAAAPTATGFMGPLQNQDAGVLFPGSEVTSAPPQMSLPPGGGSPGININQLLSGQPEAPAVPETLNGGSDNMTPAPADWITPALDINTIIGNTTPPPEMTPAPADWFEPAFDINDYLQ